MSFWKVVEYLAIAILGVIALEQAFERGILETRYKKLKQSYDELKKCSDDLFIEDFLEENEK